MRIVTFAISATGALGEEAQALITAISRRLGHTLPSSLLDEASWAVPRVGAYVRMAATFAARRGMAAHLRDTWVGGCRSASTAAACDTGRWAPIRMA